MKINIGEKNKGGKFMNDYNNFSESYSNLSHSPLTAWRRQAIRALQ